MLEQTRDQRCAGFARDGVDPDIWVCVGGLDGLPARDRCERARFGDTADAGRWGAGLRGLGTEAALCRGRSGSRDTRLDARERSLGGRGASTRVFL